MKLTLLMMCLTVCTVVYGQRTVEERKKALQEIAERTKAADLERQVRVSEYLEKNNLPQFETVETDDGSRYTRMIYDVAANGQLTYISTDNTGAAATTGADYLADERGLGFGLTGEGVQVAVWDGGLVRTSHVEFAGKNVTPSDGASSLDGHANHVIGTIMAQGVNQSARGMAPNVQLLAYDFNSWQGEQAQRVSPDDKGILLSNHSYGQGMGWTRGGGWVGDPNISDQEDWKFGFYGAISRSLDEIAFNSPYYLQCWSAGNQRGDQAGSPYPPDGPFDCIGWEKTAKNILSVGAVTKLSDGFENAADVTMSSFSSWGPVDDGRIKPDLVGAGVNLFSTFESFDEHYGTISGTSMSTPNVAGTLALLQELNKKTTGSFLKSATLKGLAIHTTNEAGIGPGPDYKFGWGLMNARGAAELILQQNGANKRIQSIVLADGDNYSFEITPQDGTEVKVTICWTDVPGTPVAPQLDPTDLMLVNDLDIRITNGTDEHMPYILDPGAPAQAATTGDNFRDNVEKVEYVASGDQPYTVTISHKGSLENQMQEFALIVSYESDDRQTFYRIGSGNQWDNPENWSLSSGGSPAMQVPGADDAVVFDNNTFNQMVDEATESELVYVLSQDIEIRSLIATSANEARIELNGNTISTTGSLSASVGQVAFTGEGRIIMKDDEASTNYITGSAETFANIDITIDYENESVALIDKDLSFKSITVENGRLQISSATVTVETLTLSNTSGMDLTSGGIKITSNLTLSETAAASTDNSTIFFEGQTSIEAGTGLQNASVEVTSGTLTSSTDLSVDDLILKLGSSILQTEGTTITVNGQMNALGREGDHIELSSITGKAAIVVESNALFCFDFLDVNGVDISGSGAFNVGPNGSIQNADGWQMKACEDVLYADFTVESVCEGSVMSATDISNGNVTGWKWYVDGTVVSETAVPTFNFPERKTYEIRLEVTDDAGDVDAFALEVIAQVNTLEENEILIANGQLVSRQPAETYQWYFDGLPIDGETERTYTLSGEAGIYFVVTGDGECFRKSPELDFAVTSVDDNPQLAATYNVYPNPAQNVLTIAIESLQRGELVLEVTDMSGRTLYSNTYTKSQFAFEQTIDTSELPNGLYVINVSQGGEKESKLVSIKK